MKPNWAPFRVETESRVAPRALSYGDIEGIADRLRAAAFAELQAEAAFLWAADRFTDAPEELRTRWRELAAEERKHLGWLLGRLETLGRTVDEVAVHDRLWYSLVESKDAREFSILMAGAEDRGRKAGERFEQKMREFDPESARIFGQIALEERAHIELARKYFSDEAANE